MKSSAYSPVGGHQLGVGAGDPARLAGAIWAYNHADWYVRGVLDLAIRYGAAGLHATAVEAASLLANPNLTIGPEAAADIAAGRVDRPNPEMQTRRS